MMASHEQHLDEDVQAQFKTCFRPDGRHEENWERWMSELETTHAPQAQGHLAKVVEIENPAYEPGAPSVLKDVGFCCLGIGCELVPGIDRDGVSEHDEVDRYAYYGVHDSSELAPFELAEWLGMLNEEQVEAVQQSGKGVDFVLDTHVQPAVGTRWVSTTQLNDDWKLTFPQIAQMLRYFGVRWVTAS